MQALRDRPAGELVDLGQAANLGPQSDVHGASLLGSGAAADADLPEQFAEPDQPLARFRAAADGRRRQRQHLHQRQLVGDQVALEQFLPSLLQSWLRQLQPAAQRAVAVERQPVAVGHGREKQVQQHGLARQIIAMLAQEAAIQPGPARRRRLAQALGNQNAFGDHAWNSG